MAKDRAAPFSRKHRKYWLPVTGGMILIGAINIGLGYCAYERPPPAPQKIELTLPPSTYARDAGVMVDAAPAPDGPDAAPPTPR